MMTAYTWTKRAGSCAALLAIAWAMQACGVPTDPDTEEGQLGEVPQAVVPGTYRFHLSDDGNVLFNEFVVPNPTPPPATIPMAHSITLGTSSNPVKYFDLVIDAEGRITDASSNFFPATFGHNTNLASCAGFTNPVLTRFRFTGVDQTLGQQSFVDPGAGTITLYVEAEVEFQYLGGTFDLCTTDPFVIEVTGSINDPSGCGHGLGATEFCVAAMNFTVPTFPAQCATDPTYGTCLNDDFELGSNLETSLDLHGHTDPDIH